MICAASIFFSANWHQKLLTFLCRQLDPSHLPSLLSEIPARYPLPPVREKILVGIFGVFFIFLLLFPLRFLWYPGNSFWTEEGYRFSWRVMLMEKNGYTSFIVRDPVKGKQQEVDQDIYLTPFQKQQLRSQPDMTIQFSRYLGDEFKARHGYSPEVFVKSRISLNGRRSQVFTNDTLDVNALKNPMQHNWIIPLTTK